MWFDIIFIRIIWSRVVYGIATDSIKPYLNKLKPITWGGPEDRYFKSRGIMFKIFPSDIMVRSKGTFAMIMRDFYGIAVQVQYTNVDTKKKVFVSNIPIPPGSSAHIFDDAPVMGVAEGLETALSASILFDIPVRPTTGRALLATYIPPEGTKKLYIFGDNNSNMVGQEACYRLAERMKYRGIRTQILYPFKTDTDWNDVLMEKVNETRKCVEGSIAA